MNNYYIKLRVLLFILVIFNEYIFPQYLITTSIDNNFGYISVWDENNGNLIKRIQTEGYEIPTNCTNFSTIFSNNMDYMCIDYEEMGTGVGRNNIQLWDFQNNNLIKTLDNTECSRTDDKCYMLRYMKFTKDSEYLLGAKENGINVYYSNSGELKEILKIDGYPICLEFAINSDNQVIALLNNANYTNQIIALWDLKSSKLIKEIEIPSAYLIGIYLSPDEKIAIVEQFERKTYYQLNLKDYKIENTWNYSQSVYFLGFINNDKCVFKEWQGNIYIYNLVVGNLEKKYSFVDLGSNSNKGGILLTPDRKYLVIVNEDKLFFINSNNLIKESEITKKNQGFAFNYNSTSFATISSKNTIEICDSKTAKVKYKINENDYPKFFQFIYHKDLETKILIEKHIFYTSGNENYVKITNGSAEIIGTNTLNFVPVTTIQFFLPDKKLCQSFESGTKCDFYFLPVTKLPNSAKEMEKIYIIKFQGAKIGPSINIKETPVTFDIVEYSEQSSSEFGKNCRLIVPPEFPTDGKIFLTEKQKESNNWRYNYCARVDILGAFLEASSDNFVNTQHRLTPFEINFYESYYKRPWQEIYYYKK